MSSLADMSAVIRDRKNGELTLEEFKEQVKAVFLAMPEHDRQIMERIVNAVTGREEVKS